MTTLDFDHLIADISDRLSSLPYAQRVAAARAFQQVLHEDEATVLNYVWPLHARPSQLPPKDDWNTWLILAGRGFGKTRTGAEWVRAQVENGHARRIALVARSLTEAQSIMIEGESGILNISPPSNRPIYEPSKRKLTWPNGAHALVFSSHEPDQLRGPQFDAAWCDELASWEYPSQTWDNLNFALRLGRRPRSVVTTTPKSIELVKTLTNGPGVHVTRGTTFDNKDNLAPAFFDAIIDQYDGTSIGRQEIYAELIDEDENALWKREWIEKARLSSYPPIARIVVSIDPAMSTRPNSSETGIVVVGADMHREHAYVLADESGRLTPQGWAMRSVHLFDKFGATRIHRRGQRGRRPRQVHPQGRRPPHAALQGHQGQERQAHPRRTRRRPLRAGASPPRRPLPRARRPDVYLDPRPRPLPLPRPRRRPRPRHHRADARTQPRQNLGLLTLFPIPYILPPTLVRPPVGRCATMIANSTLDHRTSPQCLSES